MEKAGRIIERIVAAIEATIDGGVARVQSPAFIDGKLSGSKREVDVAIYSTIGSCEVLAIVEVRARGPRQGPDWIEQVSAKRRDVGAQVAIAVSASGFTSGAAALASYEGIQVRTLADVDTNKLLSQVYWSLPTVNVITNQSLKLLPIIHNDQEKHEKIKFTLDQLYVVGGIEPINGQELIEIFPIEIWNSAKFRGNKIRFEFRLRLPRPDGFTLELRTQNNILRLSELYVDYCVTYKRETLTYKNAHEYQSPDGLSYGYFEANHPLLGSFVLVCQTGGIPQPLPTEIISLPKCLGGKGH